VKNALKSWIVWFMLLAVPLQAFASATMFLCAPVSVRMESNHQRALAEAPHQHDVATSLTAASVTGDVQNVVSDHRHNKADTAHHHADGKCGSCASCGCGASMVPSFTSSVPVVAPHFESVPFNLAHVPTVAPALPERPPRV
jgi:hypothetical protein